jgi:hypothetical protein
MKTKTKFSRVTDQYGMIEPLEPRIAPAAVLTDALPANPVFRTVTVGSAQLLTAGEVLTTGAAGGGAYLIYVEAGQILVHTTDLNNNLQYDANEITGISAGPGARFVSFVDIHGSIVTDLNPDHTLTDGGKGDILLDNNIAEIDLRSLNTGDFASAGANAAALVTAHLKISSYSIFGNIYAGGGLGVANDPTSGLHIDTSGAALLATTFNGETGTDYYQPTQPVIGSIYVGTSATGQSFNFGNTGSASDIHGNLLAFNPLSGEAGASIYNISAGTGETFNIGTIHAGNGGFNAPGGSIVNVALQGDNAGVYKLIAGNGGTGTTGGNGGSIVNFSETGAILSEVVLQSGNGGTGLTGAGGNGGQIGLSSSQPVHINAHLVLNYGSGGDGYSKGGTGGGTPSGNFVTPEGQITVPLDVVSTMHTIGSIGTTTQFDFVGPIKIGKYAKDSGFADAVFSTTNPNQVVVALGTGGGLDSPNYIYLNSPAQVDSIAVADFTGAKNPVTGLPELDIAVASGVGSNAGIEVFVSQYDPKTGAFLGFSDPIFSPLPALTTYGFLYTSTPIVKLLAGDFTGNGTEQLAAVVTETYLAGTGFATDSVVMFLTPETDATHPAGTGYFYANTANGNNPFVDLNHTAAPNDIFLVTALKSFTPTPVGSSTSNGHDSIIYTAFGTPWPLGFSVISDANGNPAQGGGGSFSQVDTNRLVSVPNTPEVTLTTFTVQSMTVIQDPKNPTIADVVAISQPTLGFMETFTGSGAGGNFTLASGTGDQAGIDFAGQTSSSVGIVTVPNPATGVYDHVGVLSYGIPDVVNIYQFTADLSGPRLGVNGATKDIAPIATYEAVSGATDQSVVAFDAYYPYIGSSQFGFITADPTDSGSLPGSQYLGISTATTFSTAPFKIAGYFFNAGNGGNSESGPGGAGGSLGQSLSVSTSGGTTTATGTLSIEFPADPSYEGLAHFVGGNGGNGFTNGGAGGSLSGISVTYKGGGDMTGTALLFAGNGGESLTGIGGAGGSLSQLSIYSGELYASGNGGIGVIGGSGGSLLGNAGTGAVSGSTNNIDPFLVLRAGDGATGILGGGSGGSILSFVNEFPAVFGGVTGLLNYTAGKGGDAVAGQAGTGGSIVNSSPSPLYNNLVGDIYLGGGAGGSGLHGGTGGSVTNFDQVSTIEYNPTSSTIIGGKGGNSTLGLAGAGGSISGIDVAASGSGYIYTFDYSNPAIVNGVLDALISATPISYNRMVAGPGGSSIGGAGGAGGGVSTINTTSSSSNAQYLVAAGAGGDGLSKGGAGGSVNTAIVDAGSVSGKVVVIAGDGGASYSVAPSDPKNPLAVAMAIGGVNGPGGAGGSINNFTQPSSVNTHVDLIAGNGGATINHSVAAGNATTDNSGVGGSITNIAVTGSIGNSDPNVAIKSYNNVLTGYASYTSDGTDTGTINYFYTGTTMQDFINNCVLGTISLPILNSGGQVVVREAGISLPMNDSVGNVGLVAGAAGRVEGGVPSSSGVSGSVSNISATNIMSMVAGDVDQVDLIQSLTNYGVTTGNGTLGANKIIYYDEAVATPFATIPTDPFITVEPNGTPLALGNLNYISTDGAYTNTPLPGGGELIDGAFVAKNIRDIVSPRDFVGTQA